MLKRITKAEAKRRYYAKEPLYYCDPNDYAEGDVKYIEDECVIPITRDKRNEHFFERVRAVKSGFSSPFEYDIVWLSGESREDGDCREKCLLDWQNLPGEREGLQ